MESMHHNKQLSIELFRLNNGNCKFTIVETIEKKAVANTTITETCNSEWTIVSKHGLQIALTSNADY